MSNCKLCGRPFPDNIPKLDVTKTSFEEIGGWTGELVKNCTQQCQEDTLVSITKHLHPTEKLVIETAFFKAINS